MDLASINATVNLEKAGEARMEFLLNQYVGKKVELRAKGEFGIFQLLGSVILESVSKHGILVKAELLEQIHYIAWEDVKSLSLNEDKSQ